MAFAPGTQVRGLVAVVVVACAGLVKAALVSDPAMYVNTFMGSSYGGGGPGQHDPSVGRPFGMISWGPDNSNAASEIYSGGAQTCMGFSLLHNTGWGPRAVSFVPTNRTVTTSLYSSPDTYYSDFAANGEFAEPGYSRTRMANGITVELTSSARCGMGLFKFPRATPASLILDCSQGPGVATTAAATRASTTA